MSSKDKLLIALAQINLCVGNISSNTKHIIEYIEKARASSVDLIIFPELAVTSYPPEDLLLRSALHEQIDTALQQITAKSTDIGVIIGFPERTSEGLYNACSLIKDGHQQALYFKRHLPNYGVFDEKRYFSPGDTSCLFDLTGIPTALTICEDLWSSVPISMPLPITPINCLSVRRY